MKKLLILILSSILVALPALADWQEEAIDGFFARAERAIKGRDSSDIRFSLALQYHGGIAAECIGFAGNKKTPAPEEMIALSVRIHNMLLRGQVPPQRALRQFGIACLTHIEDTMIKQGASKQEIKKFISQTKKSLSKPVEKFFGNQ